MNAWGYSDDNSSVVEHGVDIDFWQPDDNVSRDNTCLSIVNDWPNRDWCCGYNLWRQTVQGLPVKVFAKVRDFLNPQALQNTYEKYINPQEYFIIHLYILQFLLYY